MKLAPQAEQRHGNDQKRRRRSVDERRGFVNPVIRPRSVGPSLSAARAKSLPPATSSLSSPPVSACSTSSSLWRWAHTACYTPASPRIPTPTGHRSNSAKRSPAAIPPPSSFPTRAPCTRETSTSLFPVSMCAPRRPRSAVQRRARFVNASSAQLAANASITLFRSAKATSTASFEKGPCEKTADASIIPLALA